MAEYNRPATRLHFSEGLSFQSYFFTSKLIGKKKTNEQ
jgi:hypothetical protein